MAAELAVVAFVGTTAALEQALWYAAAAGLPLQHCHPLCGLVCPEWLL